LAISERAQSYAAWPDAFAGTRNWTLPDTHSLPLMGRSVKVGERKSRASDVTLNVAEAHAPEPVAFVSFFSADAGTITANQRAPVSPGAKPSVRVAFSSPTQDAMRTPPPAATVSASGGGAAASARGARRATRASAEARTTRMEERRRATRRRALNVRAGRWSNVAGGSAGK
jgi:hypothetical protein